jgi:hypothetical protein
LLFAETVSEITKLHLVNKERPGLEREHDNEDVSWFVPDRDYNHALPLCLLGSGGKGEISSGGID